MIIRGKEKWKEVIEAQKQSGLTIKKYCNDNPICISSFYKQKALILDEENIFIPVIIDKSNDVIDFDIDRDVYKRQLFINTFKNIEMQGIL